MRIFYNFSKKAVLIFFLLPLQLLGQQALHQLIIASGGAFSNPNDFVTVAAYQPNHFTYQSFGEIRTQAVQHALVDGSHLFVAATDSLVKYHLDSFQRLAAIAVSGPKMLHVHGDLLFMSIQYPETSNFVRVYNKNSLELITSISEISGEAAGMVFHAGKIYVAVPGNWMSTVGKLAILNAANGNFIEEIDFGSSGMGIHNLFVYDNQLVSVNKSAWGVSSGVISFYDLSTNQLNHYTLPHVVGKGIVIQGDLLYLLIDNGIGSFNLASRQIVNPAIVSDPGSASFTYFADVVFDHIGQKFYATTSDFFSFGSGYVYNLDGQTAATFVAGISAEALALDYRNISQIATNFSKTAHVFPNPAGNHSMLNIVGEKMIVNIDKFSLDGQFFGSTLIKQPTANLTLDIATLPKGSYVLKIRFLDGSRAVVRFIK